ncbi:uncharacterized protein LOC108602586 isoform X3 [Drosophila busckii]|uniref:uncharacterized protein LOC108602586 isoform X3 n=1 Tax=Drosophila busckii TaxID=30019 RepID=UPI00083F2CB4|nr:uncharacterized protein LOC108602586 isoform X3 [Drosophila busckii]
MFQVNIPVILTSRFPKSRKTYEAQLEHEIKQMIDFQRSAADACYFVRCMAYTTFWPPLHNMTEVRHTGKHFFRLTRKEKSRFLQIMNTDIT